MSYVIVNYQHGDSVLADAEQLPDGSLRIFACYKDKRIAELTVPPDQWAWRFPKN